MIFQKDYYFYYTTNNWTVVDILFGNLDICTSSNKCKWVGKDVKYVVVSEEEFMKYLDDKGEEVG